MRFRNVITMLALSAFSLQAADYAEYHVRRAEAETPAVIDTGDRKQAEQALERICRQFVPTQMETPPERLVFPVARYGAVGDGVTDDGDAIRRAVAAATKAGQGSVVRFDDAVYFLGPYEKKSHHILLDGVKGLTIDGRGAKLRCSPFNDFLALAYCERINVLNLTFEYTEPVFTQGRVVELLPAENAVVAKLDDGYPIPKSDEWYLANKMKRGYTMLVDSEQKFRKKSAALHHWVSSVADLGDRKVKIVLSPRSARDYGDFAVRDRLTLSVPSAGREWMGKTADSKVYGNCAVSVLRSSGCLFENLTFHGSRGMTFRVQENSGYMAFRRISITPRPGSADLVSGITDGMHCPNNRAKLLIEFCTFENMLDDAINLMTLSLVCLDATPTTAVFKTTTPAVGRLYQRVEKGDRLFFFDQKIGKKLGEVILKNVSESNGRIEAEWENPIKELKTYGKERKQEDFCVYNVTNSASGSIVRNNYFYGNRRHALLVRAPGVSFYNNLVRDVGGCGVYAGNEIGRFPEGPFPYGLRVSGNLFDSCAWSGVDTRVHAGTQKPERLIAGPAIENNLFICAKEAGIKLCDAENARVKDNSFVTTPGIPPVRIQNAELAPGCDGNRFREGASGWKPLTFQVE